jgi:hypothetical protein
VQLWISLLPTDFSKCQLKNLEIENQFERQLNEVTVNSKANADFGIFFCEVRNLMKDFFHPRKKRKK